jgi:hypothetical protein
LNSRGSATKITTNGTASDRQFCCWEKSRTKSINDQCALPQRSNQTYRPITIDNYHSANTEGATTTNKTNNNHPHLINTHIPPPKTKTQSKQKPRNFRN